ncbi:hypothetical protein SERLADRAFT_447095 [Serpula lacrymans var. lacrymans S7.9]|uniref:SWR1-complex protein 4 n=1 Tax=Serpula lacrymans var. lacrymans (strain S7.9) TaxID=578457 RepID=F8NME0_SERL9|nr:uncharacterized protein SERLADRAFT_447095 [Serpula lacrymans var. lacrymans S7.9]EGO27874.1 hypothetical protein SERLADRAFT_447095 [Serpula lacrymans var. lacrymans S7.9]
MAATAADIRSALSLPTNSAAGPSQPQPRKSNSTNKKPEGISRELYALIGPSAPSLAAQLAKPRLKQKPNLGGGGKVKWEWRSFKNGARSDSLQLGHWVKATTDPSAEYPFEKYNVKSTIYTYSQDEYTRFLDDKEWTKEETDYLFELVRDYDMRWYIIYDRYEYPDGTPRSMEDLKDRYYSVCRKLIRNRPWAGDETSKIQLISSFQFDKDRETTRKKYVASLENRTQDEIAEEEALFIELKRLEQSERRFKKEREELLRTLAGIDSGLPDVIPDEDGPASLTLEVKKKKKGAAADLETPTTPSNIISLGPPVPKRAQSVKSAAQDAHHCIVRTDPPPATTPATKAAHTPVHLRSFKLPAPKAAIAPKVAQLLTELSITHTRLVMPTRDNCAQLESLIEAASALIDTKKVVDKTEQDIRVLKVRLGSRASEGADTGVGTPMDAEGETEGGDAEGEDGRAQSVVSTKSGRGRKQSRRSVSISSIDTSGSVSARAGPKRQKRI